MEATCEHCGAVFAARRADARFCSPAHRAAHARRPGVAGDRAVEGTPPPAAAAETEHEFYANPANLEPAGPPRKRNAHPCCKHCRHGTAVTGHIEGCRQGCP